MDIMEIAATISFLANIFLCGFGRVIATKDLTTATTENLGGILKLISEHPLGLGCVLIILGTIGMSMSLFALVKSYEDKKKEPVMEMLKDKAESEDEVENTYKPLSF